MEPRPESEFQETVIEVRRVTKKTKGGSRMGFSVLMVVGDRKGRVGVGVGKASDVVSGIRKGISQARKSLIRVPMRGTTIPYRMSSKFSAARVLLKPAPSGSGIIAGGALRAVLEAAGVGDAVAKMLGSRSKVANIYALLSALSKISQIQEKKGL